MAALIGTVVGCSAVPRDSDPEAVGEARELLRPAVTKSERDDSIEDCLEERGSAAWVRRPTGGFAGTEIRPHDEEAMAHCVEQSFERWPNPPAPKSRAEYQVLYELYLKEADCLRSLGHSVDPPSLDTYVDGNGEWIPYDDLPEPGSALEWEQVNSQCPQDPWHYDSTR